MTIAKIQNAYRAGDNERQRGTTRDNEGQRGTQRDCEGQRGTARDSEGQRGTAGASIFAPFRYFGAPKCDPRVELALLGVTWDTFSLFLFILASFLNDSGVMFDRFLNDLFIFCWPMLFKVWLDFSIKYTPHFLEKFPLDPRADPRSVPMRGGPFRDSTSVVKCRYSQLTA